MRYGLIDFLFFGRNEKNFECKKKKKMDEKRQ